MCSITTSPYLIKNALVSAILTDEIYTGTNRFILCPYTFFNNTGLTLSRLRVNFGDGNPIANMNVDYEVTVNYTTAGQKTLTLTAEFTNGTTQTTYANLQVASISGSSSPVDIVEVEAKIAFTPYIHEGYATVKGKGQVGYYYNKVNGVDDKNLNKVAIILDGFDPHDERDFRELYNKKMTYDGNKNIIEDLKQDGYDVLVLNFHSYPIARAFRGWQIMRDGGADYVERNAFVLIELIEQVKLKLAAAGSNEKIIIIGPSMGGLISRYALAYMEQHNMDSRCKLWVSFDSPHLGANINIANQLMFEYMNRSLGFVGSIKDAVYQLDAVAAQQMLIHHYKAVLEPQITALNLPDPEKIAGSPNFRERFAENMRSIGFPTSSCIRNVALLNGTDLGTIQSPERTFSNPSSCSEAFNITLGFAPSVFVFKFLFGTSGPNSITMSANNSPANSDRCKVFDASVGGILGLFPKKYSQYIKGNGFSKSFDVIAGGIYAVNKQIPGGDIHLPIANITRRFSNQSFIPTYSSMAISPTITNVDWASNLSYYRNNPMSGTPFKAIYAPPSNQDHVFITTAGVTFIKEQVLLAPCN